MESKTVLLDPACLALAAFAAPLDEGRDEFAVLHVTTERAEATNGHVMARLPLPAMDSADFPIVTGLGQPFNGAGLMVSAESAKQALKSLPKRPTIPVLGMAHLGTGTPGTMAEGSAILVTTDMETSKVSQSARTGRAFPELDRVTPARQDSDRLLPLSAHYLKAIAEYAIKYGAGDRPYVAFYVGMNSADNGTAFEVTIEDGRTLNGVIMPVRTK